MDDQDPLMLSQKPPYIRPINSHSVQVVFKVGQKLEAETRSQKPEARNQKPIAEKHFYVKTFKSMKISNIFDKFVALKIL